MLKRGTLISEKWVYFGLALLVIIIGSFIYVYISSGDESFDTAKAKINKGSTTVLKSADGMVILVVPKNAEANSNEVSIGMIENPKIDASNRASEIYKFGPEGTEFSAPVELRMAYRPGITGECPSLVNFYHFDEAGKLKEVVPSKQVYCASHLAIFEIDSFSNGYVGKAVRDEEVVYFNER